MDNYVPQATPYPAMIKIETVPLHFNLSSHEMPSIQTALPPPPPAPLMGPSGSSHAHANMHAHALAGYDGAHVNDEHMTPPDTLSAPTPELPHAREDDIEMHEASCSQATAGSLSQDEHGAYMQHGSGGSSKARHRSRSRSIRYTPYENEPAPPSPVAPKQSKMTGRPQMSYAELITDAICESETGWLSLQEIYEAIKAKYSFFRTADPAWQNSIRHNLSVNATFTKVPRPADRPGKGSLWTTTKYPHGYEGGNGDSAGEDGQDEKRKQRRPRKTSAGESRPRQPSTKQTDETKANRAMFSQFVPEASSPERSGEDSACSTAAGGGSRAGSPTASTSPKAAGAGQPGNPNYDLVAEGMQVIPDVEKVHAGRKTMQLLAESAFAAPNLRHILQFPTLPSDKAFGASTATICIEEEESGDNDPDLAGYLRHPDSSDPMTGKSDRFLAPGAPANKALGRQSPWSMLSVPTMGPDGKPMDFGKDLFGRSRNGSPLPFLYSLSRATSPCSFLLGSWYGGPGSNSNTLNIPMHEEAPPKLPSRLSSTSIVTESGEAN